MPTPSYQTLKGFRDFVGFEAKKRAWLIDMFTRVFESQGFEPLETPALEYEELLLGKYGEEANKLIYGFEDRGERRVALRYDQTVPTARVVAQYRNTLLFPYKRYQIQQVWRADKPQKGRYREFTHCDIDIIDAKEPIADAQILATISQLFSVLGVEVNIKINSREQLIRNIRSIGVDDTRLFTVIQTIDKLDKKSGTEVVEELREKGLSAENCNKLFELLKHAQPEESLAAIMRTATALGVPESQMTYSATLARGLDYYTGAIFEVILPEYSGGSVGGGGRYDNLIGNLVGLSIPAVGMAFGFDRLVDALSEMEKFPSSLASSVQALVTIFNPESVEYAASIVKFLHKSSVTCELYPDMHKKLETQIKYALAKHIPYVIVAGPEEQQNRTVTIKNLLTREQKKILISELAHYFSP